MRGFVLAALLLGACTTPAGYEALLRGWEGKKESELVAKWGAPDAIQESEGVRTLTYRITRSGATVGTQPQMHAGPTPLSTPWTSTCKTVFRLRNGVVSGWNYEGDSCKA